MNKLSKLLVLVNAGNGDGDLVEVALAVARRAP